MQVSFQNNFNYQTKNNSKMQNFGMRKIDDVKIMRRLADGALKPIKATFSELEFDNPKDIKLVNDLKQEWGKDTKYTNAFALRFLQKEEDSRFFVSEIIEGGKKKIANIMQVMMPNGTSKSYMEIELLQSAPDIADKAITSPIRGSGAVAMYEATKLAKNNDCSHISLFSTADRFYEKIGMEDNGSVAGISLFSLAKNRYDSFMENIVRKYMKP